MTLKRLLEAIKRRAQDLQNHPRYAVMVGPLFTALTILLFFAFDLTPQHFANPPGFLVIYAIYSALKGGARSGLVSAGMVCGYFGYLLQKDGAFDPQNVTSSLRLLKWTIASPIIVLIIGRLKRETVKTSVEEESVRRIEQLTEFIPQLVWTATPQGEVDYFNERWNDYVTFRRPQVDQWDWKSIVHPEEHPICSERWLHSVATGEPFELEFRIRRPSDGVYRWFLARACAIRDSRGKITKWIGTCTDIEERRRSEEARVELSAREKAASAVLLSEARLRAIFDSAFDAVIGIDAEGRVTNWNPRAEVTFGWKSEEAIGQSLAQLIVPPHYREAHARGFERYLKTGDGPILNKVIETEAIRKSGELFPVELSVTPVRIGNTILFTAFLKDITERKQAENSLKETTKVLSMVIKSSPVGILLLDLEQKLTVWNPACEQIFGWTEAEVLGKSLPFIPPDQRTESAKSISRALNSLQKTEGDADRVRKDGTKLKISYSAVPLSDGDGRICGILGVVSDITDRYQAAKDLIEANEALSIATRAKSDFLANMSHEIRTPINGVVGMTGLLLDTKLDATQKEYAETIRSSADTLLVLINDILDFSKIEAGKLSLESIDFDLEDLVQNIERTQSYSARRKGIKLLKSVSPDLATTYFRGDPTRIGQILTNLINNAIKFTSKGYVAVEVSQKQESQSQVTLLFEVSDTGIGISEEMRKIMFRPFTQADASTSRRFGGTGLGLSISKHLTMLMGGEIGLTSEEGQGSTFWFTLNLEKGTATDREKKHVNATVRSSVERPIRILLAEDNMVNQKIAIKMLEKFGYRVDAVANGNEVLEALRSIPYDLILMDCQMPDLDGYQTTRLIRETLDSRIRQIPIVAMTANAMQGDREKCLDAGMNDYVSKPVKAEDLTFVIERLLSLKIAA